MSKDKKKYRVWAEVEEIDADEYYATDGKWCRRIKEFATEKEAVAFIVGLRPAAWGLIPSKTSSSFIQPTFSIGEDGEPMI